MNAKEARLTVLEARTEKSKVQYENIKKQIAQAVANNSLETSWGDSIEEPVRRKLEEEGFEVGKTCGGFRNEYYTKISW